jgi:hypothetical protein
MIGEGEQGGRYGLIAVRSGTDNTSVSSRGQEPFPYRHSNAYTCFRSDIFGCRATPDGSSTSAHVIALSQYHHKFTFHVYKRQAHKEQAQPGGFPIFSLLK